MGGLGEKFSANLFTGTGNFSVPIGLPAGRGGLQPQVSLSFSTGGGNGLFGLGWSLSLPGISRKTSRGVPRYRDIAPPGGDPADTFILSGAEDLVLGGGCRPQVGRAIARVPGGVVFPHRARPRLVGRLLGGARARRDDDDVRDPAAQRCRRRLAGPGRRRGPGAAGAGVAWKITETSDVFGNVIRYTYVRDRGDVPGHRWDRPVIGRIDYADYGDQAIRRFW